MMRANHFCLTASWEIMLGSVVGFMGLSVLLRIMGVESIPNPLYGMLLGGFLFGTVFMATDPITAPKTKGGKWVYSILVGVITVIIRGFALFAGGMMFAILIGNTFAPIMDYTINSLKKRSKAKREVAKA